MKHFVALVIAAVLGTQALTGCTITNIGAPPPPSPYLPFGDNQAWMLVREMTYRIGASTEKITVPRGFVTDFASTPRILWSVIPPYGQYSRAAVIHDYLYWTQICTREQADNLMLIAMMESDVSQSTQRAIHEAVRRLGQAAWEENSRLKKMGYLRVVPVDARPPHPNEQWDAYRSALRAAGVKEPLGKLDSSYCGLGDRLEVPK